MGKKAKRKSDADHAIKRSLRNTPPAYIDLIDYVKLRTRCSTSTAKRVLLAGALMVDSHPVGFKYYRDQKVLDPYLPAEHRDKIVVRMPKELK